MKADILLSGQEKRILSNKKQSNADLIQDTKMFQNVVKECLAMNMTTEQEDGTFVDIPLAKILAVKKVAYLMEHPRDIDFKEIKSALGEDKIEASVEIKTADELFGDIVNKN